MNKKELRKLGKSELIRILFQQEERIQKIERVLKAFDNAHTPSSKKKKRSKKKKDGDVKKPRFPGKPKGGNGGGIRMPAADESHPLRTLYRPT